MDRPTPASTLWPAGVLLLGEEAAEAVLHRWIGQEREALALQRTRWMVAFERALAAMHGRASHDVRGAAGVLHALVQLGDFSSTTFDRVRRQVSRLVEVADANDGEVGRAWAGWARADDVDDARVRVAVESAAAYDQSPAWAPTTWPTVATCAMPWSPARFRVTLACADLEGARAALSLLPRAVNPRHGTWAAWAAVRVMPGLRIAGAFERDSTVADVVWAWASASAEAAGEACVELEDGRFAWCVPEARALADTHLQGAEPRPFWPAEPLPVAGGRLRYGTLAGRSTP